tara:strand:+ start:2930 stop:3217 length:288 start_codon:yes stop_codon:yes gene_type:complete
LKEPQYINLTHTKALLAVTGPLVFVLFFFFSLQSDIARNKEKIEGNTASIEKLEARMESMSDLLQENNTNIKLIQLQMAHMYEKMSGSTLPTQKE